ncbi:8482_t:CDS:2, partial [Paraglomus brasilianum]
MPEFLYKRSAYSENQLRDVQVQMSEENFSDYTTAASNASSTGRLPHSSTETRTLSSAICLNKLATELKVEIILHSSNPTTLARCSHEWNNIVNSPSTKAMWLIGRHGRTHALFHAVRMGNPFIKPQVVECLFAQKAQISRYFIQRLELGFGNKSVNLQNKPWASNLSFDVFSRIHKERDRFDRNDIPVVCGSDIPVRENNILVRGNDISVRGNDSPRRLNDLETFDDLAGGSLGISQAITKLKENRKKIKTLIRTQKFAPFPPRPKIRKYILAREEDRKFERKLYSDIDSVPRAWDDYPSSDG